jgi:hypothetical protein
MDKAQQFTALMQYVEEDPGVLSRYGEIGKAMLEQIEQACLLEDAEALSESIDGFLDCCEVSGSISRNDISSDNPRRERAKGHRHFRTPRSNKLLRSGLTHK